ncbi:MAG: endolytic transglycosylase MltG [Mogibacterium sp.]|nr:endolytic transglycosylase MltG [Mogibacterium sp.]
MEDPSNQTKELTETTAPDKSGINKRFLKPLRIIILILAVVFAVFLSFQFISRPYDKTTSTFTNIVVSEGDDLTTVSEMLEDNGIVMKASRFRIAAKMMLLTDFKPGTYYLSPSMDSKEIARTMVKGITIPNGFTVPEGYTLDLLASSLARDGFVDKKAFIKAASDPALQDIDFIGKDVDGSAQVEGFLFPGDYTVSPEIDESMLILIMIDSFNNFFNDDYRARADELDMSIRDIIVIASMIQNITTNEKEMPEISSVIHNRINLGLAGKNEVPAIPLCSPGEKAIIAALYPADNENTYYVLSSRLDGTHVFTSDEEEYKQLLEEYETAVKERDASRATDGD